MPNNDYENPSILGDEKRSKESYDNSVSELAPAVIELWFSESMPLSY
jgi:hypothetical protein